MLSLDVVVSVTVPSFETIAIILSLGNILSSTASKSENRFPRARGCICGASARHRVTHETWECAEIHVSPFWIIRAAHLLNAVKALRHKALIYAPKFLDSGTRLH